VQAFYTTPVFKLERTILKWLVTKPSSDAQAVLLCDFKKRTRSWLMIKHEEGKNGIQTRLYFGSAVVPKKSGGS
jgi:hypothetical protein